MYAQSQIRPGQVLAGLGGLALVASLWLDWYVVTIGPGVRNALHGFFGGITGPLGGLDSLVDQLPSHVAVSGWDALAQADVFLALLGGATVAAALLSGPAGADVAARAAAIAGAIAGAITLQHVLAPPGPGGLASPAAGAWLALGASAAMIAGGLHAASAPASPAPRFEPLPPAGEPRFDATTSVAPPSTPARMAP